MTSKPVKTAFVLTALVALPGLLGACRSERVITTGSVAPADYRARHPIVLTDNQRSLDVFVTGTGHLDPRQTADLDAFVLEFRRFGRGVLVLDMPRGVSPAVGAGVERTAASIRRVAAEGGVPPRQIVVENYAVANPALSAPVRVSFQRMEAKVASQCGTWPGDLGVSDPVTSNRNEPSWNFGCASQTNFAAQVADPVDLVRGRPEGPVDSVRRTLDIGKLRQGKDPSTRWNQDGQTSVKSQVGN
ncbi:pilus assembly protein CpaD [Methylobacterium sp. Leaf399]|uniref:CpaD family pilus assembly protein n=1 Tax=unclassified Methylobacterium TaxID=2615210 RepID=UPI0006F2AB78|nr:MULTISPECIES: CpaD family pilus assembly protein [unclassified Methylobacterium]KQP61364.1 pilus assembly protein CpaD [Methylobacterium sp. Leaf108]KQT19511.1 pilus assembly protein CpaD [Methylobacterium sp. Leaf399]KQT80564.1 pilus assembly protein CpaD [Methylobacterium sp. Leaf466]